MLNTSLINAKIYDTRLQTFSFKAEQFEDESLQERNLIYSTKMCSSISNCIRKFRLEISVKLF